MPVKRYVRRNIYRWHRVTGLIVALPILLWSVSGFLHPVINSFKPEVSNGMLPTSVIDTNKIHISLQQALQQNGIAMIHNFRIVMVDSCYYYQIQQLNNDTLTYLNCNDGKLIKDGDPWYASYLAQRYLSEPIQKDKSNKSHSHEMDGDITALATNFHTATFFSKPKVTDVELIKNFSKEYKSSNVLLPVYRVNFDRTDGIRLYIETSTDRLATAIDNKRAWFIDFFAIAHTWSFLDGIGGAKNAILGIISLLCFISSVLGFFVYNIINKKKNSSSAKAWHRTLGNVFVLTTALYGISGSWHAFHKLSEKSEKAIVADRSQFSAEELNLCLGDFGKYINANEKLANVSIVKINGESYWQLFISKGKDKQKKYVNTNTLAELDGGDIEYACSLACNFSGRAFHTITHKKGLNGFTDRYTMMNKRLPVVEVVFKGNDRYYVETATGHLSTVTNSYDKAERFSFNNFHMHHYWEAWFDDYGKAMQKTVLISSTLGLLLLAISGLSVYAIKRFRTPK
jgi:hypothetical protein